ncbi:MAG: TonB-dependent receptor plug domain-containing protein [Methylotenera sp.]|uniref:TonB-dependent receptor n=1 Tax=Methylotenera sp. TaxID=2051956 RepID=UPI002488FACD|nr:TonB-dependent receptor [Methylotenera sp.]MDI1309634.1 TonB-dependent receptor plug domain-containing protein [Methylotenera sp.]
MSFNCSKKILLVNRIFTSCLLGSAPVITHAEALILPSVEVHAERLQEISASSLNTSDTAALLENEPGISLYRAGGVSSLPAIHGLADDRIRIKVDGMDLISSCANHMNPPLSYIDPSNIENIKVYAGITPVSVGGDSIAGAIQVNSATPEFAKDGQDLLIKATVGTFYRSNNDARGVNLSTSVANDKVYMRYTGSTVEANNYTSGGNFKSTAAASSDKPNHILAGDEVGSSAYKARNHALAFGVKHENHLIELKLGLQDIPYQGYPNQRMDMTGNDSKQFNLSYKGKYDWGKLEARAYYEKTRHSMQFGDDKQFLYGNAPGMPMETEGQNAGVVVNADILMTARDTLRIGAEYQRYRLDDWWPKSGTGMMMAPLTFENINNGQRDRYDIFAEWEAKWSEQWLSQVGVRSSIVKMNAGDIQGYNTTAANGMSAYKVAAAAFNALDHKSTDNNLDLTALTRYQPNVNQTYEAGYAMKTRSPNVYERFVWANTNTMVMNMNNLYGDGNGYVGNLNLTPETAHTLSATANWHDNKQQNWNLTVTPYFTYVDDYIDAVACAKVGKNCMARTDGFVNLSLDNQSARIYGVDISGRKELSGGYSLGSFAVSGGLNYVRGKNNTSNDNLYNTMPLNAKFALEHNIGAWMNTVQLKLVDSKDNVQAIRKELKTAGYGLLNMYSSYEWKSARLDLGIENVFDKHYADPLGGAYLGQGATMGTGVVHGTQIPGMGRSVNLGLTLKY